jgi:omega-hydroxy-beta-dihydromenaquinone-9 sulfotransferase
MCRRIPRINNPLIEFTRRVFISGGISLKGAFLLPVYYIQIIAGLPIAILQFLLFNYRIARMSIPEDPVFILGHYRTGTTYLQKLLASDPQFGCLTNYDSLFPNLNLLFGKRIKKVFQFLINVLKIKNPFFHDSIVKLSEPAEEDDYLMNKASIYTAYWGLVFPRRWRDWLNDAELLSDPTYLEGWKKEYQKTLKYATFKSRGKQLVLKNPPNTGRITQLLQLFPQAKFIFLYRNPFHLYYSIRNMWMKAILGFYSVQKIDEKELEEIIFEHFDYLHNKYETDKMRIPEGNLIEISYEELKADPHGVVKRIYSKLNLPGFSEAENELNQKINEESGYRNFRYNFDEKTIEKIKDRWGKYILQWNYEI